MSKQIPRLKAESQLFYPIMLKQMTIEETREYHLKKLFGLSKLERAKLDFRVDGSIWKEGQPITEEPTYELKRWIMYRLTHPNTWPKVHENKIGDWRHWE